MINWQTTEVLIADLKDWESNPRRISKKDFERLVKDIKEDGYHRRLLVNNDNTIVGGHSRRKALLEAGYKLDDKIEVLKSVEQLSENELKRLNIRDNLSFGEFDFDMLANCFDQIDLIEWGMDEKLFPVIESEVTIEDDEVQVTNIETRSKLGDVWLLGNHRLMCGDSVNPDHIDKLVNGIKVDFIYADPPYGIDLNLNINDANVKHNDTGIKGDPIINDTNTNTARDCYNLITTMFDCPLVYWGANYFTDFLQPSKCWITWHKKEDMKENKFCGAELAYTNSNKHSVVMSIKWQGMIREGEGRKSEDGTANEKHLRPTQKPVKLALDIFTYLDSGNIVFDPFGGSGTTLIACEKSNRKCLMMELSPSYCDVIINRWEKHAGSTAKLENV